MYTSVEPCAMCAASAYWANIGTIVYGMSEADLASLTVKSKENPTLRLPCREVFQRGSRNINVIGPFPELVDKIAKNHRDFWDNHSVLYCMIVVVRWKHSGQMAAFNFFYIECLRCDNRL